MSLCVRRVPSLLASACALAFGMVALPSTAFAQSGPFSLDDAPVTASSPLMLSSAAGAGAAPDDDWRFRVAFPIWMPGISGDVDVKGREASSDRSGGGDFWGDSLDVALVLHLEAEKGRWGVIADAMYVSFADDWDLKAGGEAEFDLDAFIGELDVFCTLVPPKPGVKGWGMFRADVLAGVRISTLESGLKTPSFDVSESFTLVDPIIGARMELGLLKWLTFKARGDIGGFGIDEGTTSDLVWNVETGLEFHLATWFDLGIGYRWLDYDFAKNSTEAELRLDGPVVTLQFRF